MPVRFFHQRGTPPAALLLLVGLAVLAEPVAAQEQPVEPQGVVSISAWAGLMLTTSIYTTGGSISIDPAASYGAALTLAVDPELQFQLLWTISSTRAHFVSSAGPSSSGQDHLDINYLQAGLTKTIRCADFECFGDATLGAVLLSPGAILLGGGQRLDVRDTWRAAFTLGAGIRFRLVAGLSAVLQARLLVPVYITSGGFYAGNGASVLVVSAGIPAVEGAFSAGFVLSL